MKQVSTFIKNAVFLAAYAATEKHGAYDHSFDGRLCLVAQWKGMVISMQFLRQWLLGIVACALLVSFCELLTPAGALRKLVRFTGGLLLIIAILQPITRIDLDAVPLDLDSCREAVAQVRLALEDEREAALADGIAARTGAYIEDKAEELGCSVRAAVETEDISGTPLPVSVTLHGQENAALADYIETQLGIAKEKQVWTEAG